VSGRPRIPLSFFSDVLRAHVLRIGGLTASVRTADILRPLLAAGLQHVRSPSRRGFNLMLTGAGSASACDVGRRQHGAAVV
jgi:hypothetical protein